MMVLFASKTIRGLREENAQLRAENAQLRERLAQFENAAASAVPQDAQEEPAAAKELERVEGPPVAVPAATSSGESPPTPPGASSSVTPLGSSSSSILPGAEEIKLERRRSLGRLSLPEGPKTGVDHIISGVLPLAEAFDRFDEDQSGGLSIDEVKTALEYLGVGHNSSEQARKLLMQYDNYPDRVLDVKEFSALCRDIRMMVQFDENGDGALDASELQPALESIGLRLSPEQIMQALKAFDIDDNGSIDLLELSSLIRTARAFVRYDTDKSGTIDHEEMKDALRRLGIRAGTLEAKSLFRRYDADESGSIELHEFAALVRDLQLYAAYDENLDGRIDADELHKLLETLGLPTSAATAADLLRAATDHGAGGGGAEEGGSTPPTTAPLGLSRFSTLVNELRTFRANDGDGDGALTLVEARAALGALGLRGTTSDGDDAMLGAGARARGRVTLVEFVEAVTAATAQGSGATSVLAATAITPVSILPQQGLYSRDDKERLLTA